MRYIAKEERDEFVCAGQREQRRVGDGKETWLSLLYSLLAEKTIDVLISSVFVSSLVFLCFWLSYVYSCQGVDPSSVVLKFLHIHSLCVSQKTEKWYSLLLSGCCYILITNIGQSSLCRLAFKTVTREKKLICVCVLSFSLLDAPICIRKKRGERTYDSS